MWFLRSITFSFLATMFIDWLVSLSSDPSSSVIFIFFLPSLFKPGNLREVLFLVTFMEFQLLEWAFVVGFPIWCVTKTAFSFFGLSFGLVPYFPIYVMLCIGSSLISLSQFHISDCGIVSFLLFLSYVFSCICSTIYCRSKSFSFNNLSRHFLSVIDVLSLDMSNLMLKSGKFRYILPLVLRPEKNLLVSGFVSFRQVIFLLYSLNILSFSIFSGSVRYSDRVIWWVASAAKAQRHPCGVFFSFVFFFGFGDCSFIDWWPEV